MRTVSRSALVSRSPEQMFALVDEVGRYPEFLPWCTGAEQHAVGDPEEGLVEATIHVSRSAFRGQFTTRNRRVRPERIEMELVDGPFRRLEGLWRFEGLGDGEGCRVSLELSFEIASPVLRKVLEPVFEGMANEMVDAFVRRARSLDEGGGA